MNVNILDYGAVADGQAVCTKEIQAAIDACAATGGGRVIVPTGSFVSGTIWLKSHVELHLERGARLIASKNRADYNALDAYEQNYGYAPEEWVGQHFILCVEQEDVAITGYGTIDGSGDEFFEEPKFLKWAYFPHGLSIAKDKVNLRPGQLIVFVESKNILVEHVTITNSPCWCCFLFGCDVVTVKGIKVYNPKHFCNTDGIDIDSCKYVTVSDCIISTGDDAIAVRCASYRLKDKSRTCEYITITNCNLSSSSGAIRFGVGTGAIKHVRVSNLTVEEAGCNFGFMSGWIGSGHCHLEDIHISNVSCANVARPFEIDDTCAAGIENITFENININTRYGGLFIVPQSGTVKDVTFRNFNVTLIEGAKYLDEIDEKRTILYMEGIDGLCLDRVKVQVEDSVRELWSSDVEIVACKDVEIHRCKYKELV